MVKIVHVQTVLIKEDLKKLKAATDCDTVKDALSKAVEHYIKVVGPLSVEQIKQLKIITIEQDIDAAILKVILERLI